MTEIAEAYFHLKRLDLTATQVTEVGDLASRLAAQTAAPLFPPDTTIEVRLEEGSLKGWITLIGVLGLAYGNIADYKGFKESIREIIDDGKTFSEAVTEKILSTSNQLKGSQIYRRERRTKTPGKIKRVIQKREWLESHRHQLSESDVLRESYEIERLLRQVLADVSPEHHSAVRKLMGEDRVGVTPSASSRTASPSGKIEQGGFFLDRVESDRQSHSDYHRRFLLSDELFGLSAEKGPKFQSKMLQKKD